VNAAYKKNEGAAQKPAVRSATDTYTARHDQCTELLKRIATALNEHNCRTGA
jgi:hypothetical protein